jgi:hypothetical protein
MMDSDTSDTMKAALVILVVLVLVVAGTFVAVTDGHHRCLPIQFSCSEEKG